MEIAVLSDTHLTALTDDFVAKVDRLVGEVDCFFHLGDAVVPEVLDYLNAHTLYAVAGNMDSPAIRSSYPLKREVELAGYRFGLMHGWGSPVDLDRRVAAELGDVDCVLFGHSHRQLNDRRGKKLIFNPGTAGGGLGREATYGRLTVTGAGITARHFPF